MKIQSDLEFGGKQDMSDVLETLISNCDSLQCHIEYEYQIPAALKKLEEIKQKEPDIYKKIVVNNSNFSSISSWSAAGQSKN